MSSKRALAANTTARQLRRTRPARARASPRKTAGSPSLPSTRSSSPCVSSSASPEGRTPAEALAPTSSRGSDVEALSPSADAQSGPLPASATCLFWERDQLQLPLPCRGSLGESRCASLAARAAGICLSTASSPESAPGGYAAARAAARLGDASLRPTPMRSTAPPTQQVSPAVGDAAQRSPVAVWVAVWPPQEEAWLPAPAWEEERAHPDPEPPSPQSRPSSAQERSSSPGSPSPSGPQEQAPGEAEEESESARGMILTATAAPALSEPTARRATELGDASVRTPAAEAPPTHVLLCWLAGGMKPVGLTDQELLERLLAAAPERYED